MVTDSDRYAAVEDKLQRAERLVYEATKIMDFIRNRDGHQGSTACALPESGPTNSFVREIDECDT